MARNQYNNPNEEWDDDLRAESDFRINRYTLRCLKIMLFVITVLLSVIPLLIATQYSDKKVLVHTFGLTMLGNFLVVFGGYFWDVNDLKQTNDTMGHEKGDALITAVGRIIKEADELMYLKKKEQKASV